MTKSNGLPCKKCGTSEWDRDGHCCECRFQQKLRYRQDNRDKAIEITRRWKKANPDKVAEHKRRWQNGNPDKVAERDRRSRQNNPEKHAERSRRWARDNPERANARTNRHRTKKTEAGGSYTAAEWKELCNHYGNKCLSCNRTGVKLTADHIRPVVRGGSSNIDNIQPLCLSCNSAKGSKHIDYRPDAGPLRWLQAKLFG